MIEVEIDKGSGFCFGVVTAIESAERELDNTDILYCLGDIVHNSLEVERLQAQGLSSRMTPFGLYVRSCSSCNGRYINVIKRRVKIIHSW